jgi:hypothetical protein
VQLEAMSETWEADTVPPETTLQPRPVGASPGTARFLRGWFAGERGVRLALWALVFAGLVLRFERVGRANATSPAGPERLVGDEPGYNDLALALLHGDFFDWPGRVPLYPSVLAGFHLLTRQSYDGVPYLQALLGVTVIPLTYLLARRAFARAAPGLIAAFLAASSFVLAEESPRFLSEILFTPVLLLAIITLWDALRAPSPRRFLLPGALLGMSILIRPTMILFPLVAVLLFLFFMKRRDALQCWLAYGTVTVLVVLPWTVSTSFRNDAFVPVALTNGFLWQGSPEYYHLVNDYGYGYRRIWAEVIYPPDDREHWPITVEGDRYWTKRALRSIKGEPLTYLEFAAKKLAYYWVGDPQADWFDTSPLTYARLRSVGYATYEAVQIMISRTVPILGLIAGIVLLRRWRTLLPLYFVLGYATLFHALSHAEGRLSDPFQPLFMVLIGGMVVTVWDRAARVASRNEQPAERAAAS